MKYTAAIISLLVLGASAMAQEPDSLAVTRPAPLGRPVVKDAPVLIVQDSTAVQDSVRAQENPAPGLYDLEDWEYEIPKLMNDYSMIGVSYGVSFSNMYFSPSRHNRSWVFAPNYISVMFTKHGKMFDVYPYFGLKFGFQMGSEGFAFRADEETGVSNEVDGATWCSIRVLEVPMLAHFHFGPDNFNFLIDAGIYGGWRQSIERKGPQLDPQYTNSFRDYENRIDYGLLAGAGFALIFDPVEIHFMCNLRWSWSSLYQPDYASPYYYSYAYPIDVMASVGLHFHLGKRYGKTNRQLKQEAYERVYGTTSD